MKKEDMKESVLSSPFLKEVSKGLSEDEQKKLDQLVDTFVDPFIDVLNEFVRLASDPKTALEIKEELKKRS
jgi:hypothetical protein